MWMMYENCLQTWLVKMSGDRADHREVYVVQVLPGKRTSCFAFFAITSIH